MPPTIPGEDSLAVLLLPARLDDFELSEHARALLSIPRVVALEPPRRAPRWLRDAAPVGSARRLRFPGRLRLLVIYDTAQYPLARALRARHGDAELWYVEPVAETLERLAPEDRELHAIVRDRAAGTLARETGGDVPDAPLRERLRELDVISPYAFVPARAGRWSRGARRP